MHVPSGLVLHLITCELLPWLVFLYRYEHDVLTCIPVAYTALYRQVRVKDFDSEACVQFVARCGMVPRTPCHILALMLITTVPCEGGAPC